MRVESKMRGVSTQKARADNRRRLIERSPTQFFGQMSPNERLIHCIYYHVLLPNNGQLNKKHLSVRFEFLTGRPLEVERPKNSSGAQCPLCTAQIKQVSGD
jgi:hypothetical protein